ncbi:hypothetical protein [Pseudomonas fluorescens]|uniref:Uncharacterized protein n=1 Tax=Pseudomonas fluorescens TaxID=294 RepID=A0A5E7RIP8_PSEFL|nr:hypothetical protein [Pseudomonas fluorescens]VVP73440.1 hypothetical protein PS941_00043 [Pseudomonas fluorescens]
MEKDDIVSSFFVGRQCIGRGIEAIDCRLSSCMPGLADVQMRQSPHLAGFVVESWWSRGRLNLFHKMLYLNGFVDLIFGRDTSGDTRCSLLGGFLPFSLRQGKRST